MPFVRPAKITLTLDKVAKLRINSLWNLCFSEVALPICKCHKIAFEACQDRPEGCRKAGKLWSWPLAYIAKVYSRRRYPAAAEELLPPVPAVFQGADGSEEQSDFPAGYVLPKRKPPVQQSCPCRWKWEVGGLCGGILALRMCLWALWKSVCEQLPAVVPKARIQFQWGKAHIIYVEASGHIGVIPKSETTKLLVEQAVSQLKATSAALALIKQEK